MAARGITNDDDINVGSQPENTTEEHGSVLGEQSLGSESYLEDLNSSTDIQLNEVTMDRLTEKILLKLNFLQIEQSRSTPPVLTSVKQLQEDTFKDIIDIATPVPELMSEKVLKTDVLKNIDNAEKEKTETDTSKYLRDNIPKYSGKSSGGILSLFISRAGDYYVDSPLPEEKKLAIIGAKLTDAARSWWDTTKNIARDSPFHIGSWASFKHELSLRFLSKELQATIKTKLWNIKQASRTVNDYVAEMQELNSLLSDKLNTSDEVIVFMNGLNSQLRASVSLNPDNLSDLQTCINTAVRLEEIVTEIVDLISPTQQNKNGSQKRRRKRNPKCLVRIIETSLARVTRMIRNPASFVTNRDTTIDTVHWQTNTSK